ncbi:MAG: hypothetical protein JWN67_1078 [Actinomycetia bacterium]|nr:hypothetical protein [Actinomycetes bacterium]
MLHLARRFFGSLRPGGPSAVDEAWARSQLLPGEVDVWARMSGADRRHAAGVAREVARSHDARAVVAAALLHDSGKVVSGLGTFARVGATLVGAVRGRDVGGRIGQYLRHPQLGAELLAAAGSDPLTVAWTAEHHLPPDRWSVPPDVAFALKAADDD